MNHEDLGFGPNRTTSLQFYLSCRGIYFIFHLNKKRKRKRKEEKSGGFELDNEDLGFKLWALGFGLLGFGLWAFPPIELKIKELNKRKKNT